ncbi:hypothetical protein [Lacihabitans lacunae]|uniref:Uncharacterized protein n=1 Tax=Lacihabitans lacunae TaxID=1028214 RepID=A0ABV7Z4H2_9BACT
MSKYFYHFLNYVLFILSSFGGYSVMSADSDIAQGLYVSNGALGIHTNAELVVFSDLHLDHANIAGKGKLTISSNTPTKIFSKYSTVQNLKIANSGGVKLIGHLTVLSTLELQQGSFDVSGAYFVLSDTASLIKTSDAKFISSPVAITPYRSALVSYTPHGTLFLNIKHFCLDYYSWPSTREIAFKINRYTSVTTSPKHQPPIYIL